MNIHLRQLRSCEKVLQVNFPERYTNLSINIYFFNPLFSCFENKIVTWVKIFKYGPSKICGRQPLKYLK